MVKRIVLAAVVIAAAMGVVKNGRVLKVMGLTGSCTVVETAASGFHARGLPDGQARRRPRPLPERLHRHGHLRRQDLLAVPRAAGRLNKSRV